MLGLIVREAKKCFIGLNKVGDESELVRLDWRHLSTINTIHLDGNNDIQD